MNAALKRLGFGSHDCVLVIHADDIGMCQAGQPAIDELFEFGLVSSAAVMVPCSWFPLAAAFCREHPTVDMGVHLTLNCEWEAYRWGPISTRDTASGLLDQQGYLHAAPAVTEQQADPGAVAAELRAQVERALQSGIDATHIDAHMGTALRPRFVQSYTQVALENRLPAFFLSREGAQRLRVRTGGGLGSETYDPQLWQDLEERGMPMFDDLAMLPLHDPCDHVAIAKKIVDELRPGLTVLILHPAQDTPELRAIAPDWRGRVANYQACLSEELRDYVRQSGVQLIGYRPLRELVRSA
ncbi:MAG TPA: polysaccharide deacetylase family protein [Roseiflexaceae bacterium]|nr:polysaccharide deacetylase family protein [Roseiflexaceae bacterium]